jgi:hypothetical protein
MSRICQKAAHACDGIHAHLESGPGGVYALHGADGNAGGIQTVDYQSGRSFMVLDQQDPVHQKLYM